MSDYTSLVREIRELVRDEISKQALGPTGVAPGVYNSVTVDTAGRVRYGTTTGAGMTLLAVALGVSDTMPNDNGSGDYATERCQFNTVSYDPQSTITTGTAWAFTAPTASAKYAVWASVEVGGGATRKWAIGDYAFLDDPTNSASMASWQSQAAETAFTTLHCNGLVFTGSVVPSFYLTMNLYRSGGGTTNTRYLPYRIAIYQV